MIRILSPALLLTVLASGCTPAADAQKGVVHDAEYYILEAQNGKVWAVEDGQLDAKLAELRAKYGQPPNIIQYMWDDQPPMAFGDPIYQKIRGYETPNLNALAEEGMIFARMYTEPGCTPSRAASLTGQLAIRTGTYEIGFPIEYTGFAAENVTMAEVLSQAGYATAFYGKLHLGDIEAVLPAQPGFRRGLLGHLQPGHQPVQHAGRGSQRHHRDERGAPPRQPVPA